MDRFIVWKIHEWMIVTGGSPMTFYDFGTGFGRDSLLRFCPDLLGSVTGAI